MLRRHVARALAALLAVGALACSAPLPPRPWSADVRRPVVMDVEHYDIELTIDHRAGHVQGEVAITLSALPGAPLSRIELDAVELDVQRAWTDDGAELDVLTGAETVTLTLPEPLPPGARTTVHLAWDAFPRRGLYFEGPSTSDPTRPWHVWSMGQSHEARHWLPCWDQPTDRASSELTLIVDDGFLTLAAGELRASEALPGSGRRADTWVMEPDHASYLITLVVGELARGELPGPVPLPVVARARDLDAALFATRHTAHMLEVMGALTGRPYPFAKYGQAFVDNFTAGGMENISATTMYDEGLHAASDEPQTDITGLVAHELAHQWFGDLLTCDGWGELWINEGWADWLETRYMGVLRGDDEMAAMFLDAQHGGCAAEDAFSRPVVWNDYEAPDQMFDGHSYSGAAARIRLLRSILGEQVFLRGVAAHVEAHAGELVTTDELQAVFEQVSGVDLDTFFEEWFHGVGYPVLHGVVEHDELVVRQTQADRGWRDVFHIDLTVSWSRGGEERRGVLSFGDQTEERLVLTGAGALDWVRLDADTVIPGVRIMDQPEAAWARQLVDADDGVTRLVAARWFGGDRWTRPDGSTGAPGADAVAALMQAARGDAFVRVRAAATEALADATGEAVGVALLDLSADPEPTVRVAAVEGLAGHLEGDGLAAVRASVDDPHASVSSAAVRVLVEAGRPEAWSALTRVAASASPERIRLVRDMAGLAADVDDPQALPFLLGLARTHPERWVRSAAVRGLARIDAGAHEEVVMRQLLASLHDESHQVRSTVVRTLGRRDDPRVERHLRARLDVEQDPGVMASIEQVLTR